jgi:small subunit ribosomal protein S6
MPIYETVYMARQDLTEAQVNDMTEQFTKLLQGLGAKILKTENWGLRTLAYRINKNKKAHYVLIEVDAPSDAVIELERNLRLNEDVMRSLTTRREKPSEGQSAILEKPRYESRDNYEAKEAA